jgi:hypothetical protein
MKKRERQLRLLLTPMLIPILKWLKFRLCLRKILTLPLLLLRPNKKIEAYSLCLGTKED